MEPGVKSDRTGMCLQRSFVFSETFQYHTQERLDQNTAYLIGENNFRKVDIEIRK